VTHVFVRIAAEVVPVNVRAGIGAYGERVAARALGELGMTVLDRNWRSRQGELDIVALDGDELVIVEVKTRSGLAFGHPAEAVTRAKVARLRRLAAEWLGKHDVHARDVRIDVVAVLRRRSGAALVEHVRGVL
jgi:putative endonuclease